MKPYSLNKIRSFLPGITSRGPVVAACALAAATVHSQPSDNVVVDVTDCVDIEAPDQRLDCFESRVSETRSMPPAERPVREPSAGAGNEDESQDATAEEIVATVTSFREMEPDMLLVYLDNDQVWRQSSPRRYPLRTGAEVRLRPTHWGSSYRLTDPNVGSFIQVRRIR